MTSEQSKPIALDERDVHLFFHMFGRYEPAVALGVIVMLSVWALFNILHRTIRGQRRKKDENALETEVRAVEKMTIEEQQHCHTKSTVSENLREEVSKAQDNSTGESGGVLSPPHNPDLCAGEHEFHDHASEDPESLKELASDTEVESNRHQHLCDNMESLLDNFDRDIETEKKVEFLYANLNSQPDLPSEKMSLSVMEKTRKNSHDYFDDSQRVSSQQNGLINSAGNISVFQKNTHGLDSSRSCREEQTCRITEINAMETTVKSHQEDYQHLREHCEHLSNFHYHGLLSSLHERESDRHRPPSDLPRLDAVGEVSESKTKTLKSGTSQPPEDNGEKTEINIMEATMDYNEWMNSSTAEMNKSIGWSGKIMNGTADVGIAEQCIQKLADYNLAKISITKESGTTCTLLDSDPAAVQPTTQTVAVSFCVHYITDSSFQLLAVTGNQQELGDWKEFVPLRRAKDGFWVSSVDLPADVHVEWKFVVVENGRIHRWEECSNRHLETGCENVIHLHKWWGCV
ncbi:uncharacterized protein stbd1 [Conger conger]|uniref:uncharacterized protein stbd1 n=1 Tax=Conger conger TaxID=82655 RepID=UPI002A59CD0A|nr:uncharacterized protein stbd1 [Conger conger]